MLLQLMLQLSMVLFSCAMLYLTYSLSVSLYSGGTAVCHDLRWLLEWTPAQDSFVQFIVRAVFIISAVICSFSAISKHVVISLDIIYFASILMLILYHALKNPLMKEV